jgi:type I restriction enzyme, S subunit
MSRKRMKFTDLFDYENKSSIKAGDGLGEGKYPFYTSSSIQSKYLNEFSFKNTSLIFGTGGNASIHYCEKPFSVSTDCLVAIAKNETKCHPKFIYYYLSGNINLLEEGFKGAGLKHISKAFINEIQIPLPPLPIQKRIAEILDAADALRRKDQELLNKYDELAQAIFIDKFGDPVKNEKYKKAPLSDVSEITNGVTKNGKLEHAEMITAPYMRVANVQDGYLDLKEIKDIRVSISDYNKYQLKKMDILLTEGGDPDKLGRGCIWMEEVPNSIFQNHLFRVRVNSPEIRPYYLAKLIGSKYGKKYFLKAAKQTTGIATINSSQLKAFPVIIPALNIQEEFERLNSQIDKVRSVCKMNMAKSNQLFNSLLQQAFKGELVK